MKPYPRRRPIPRVDMTPFVSVALLLITFFVWLRMLQRPNALGVAFPDPSATFCGEAPRANACLFLLGKNRIGLLAYHSNTTEADFVETDYSLTGLREKLIPLLADKSLIVLVTPTEQATFKNLVDVFSVFRQIEGSRFSLRIYSQITTEERRMLDAYQEYKRKGTKLPVHMHIKLYSNSFIPA